MFPAIPHTANAPIFGLLNLMAPRMNGWLARNVAVYAFTQVQHFSRCGRMQRKIEKSPLGSNPKFAAAITKPAFPAETAFKQNIRVIFV